MTKPTIYHIALEPIETRYTGQWLRVIKPELEKLGATVVDVLGESIGGETTSGAFLDFARTNIWKNTQINKVAFMFDQGKIKAGDKFLFTDAWHPGILQVRYMSDLLDIPVEIHAYWHAGSYDKWDFLGRKVKNKEWSYSAENAFYEAADYNWFATQFHAGLFEQIINPENAEKTHISGQPHYEIICEMQKFSGVKKENIIFFPHRLAPEKQPEIFYALAKMLPEYKFIAAQETKLTKDEYHELMAKSKIMFSASLQETLGIGGLEALLAGTIPMVPDRLSYKEMYFNEFKYPSKWSDGVKEPNLVSLAERIKHYMDHFPSFCASIQQNKEAAIIDYLTAFPMFRALANGRY